MKRAVREMLVCAVIVMIVVLFGNLRIAGDALTFVGFIALLAVGLMGAPFLWAFYRIVSYAIRSSNSSQLKA